MNRLSYKIFPPLAASATVTATGTSGVASAAPLVHVVVMHGLLGSHRNWQSVCKTLTAEALQQTPVVDSAVQSASKQYSNIRKSAVVQCAAFDWRNHGDSAHMEHSLDGLADDVEEFLGDYATSQQQPPRDPSAPPTAPPIDVVLMGHSMGGMGMLHFLWDRHRHHVEGRGTTSSSNNSAPLMLHKNPLFYNDKYRIVGAVAVDIAPAARPESFQAMITAVCFLRELPQERMNSYGEMEEWLLANGPKPYYTKANIWMIRYFLSNVDVPQRRWKAGIEEIIEGTGRILWPHDNTVAGSGGAVAPLIEDFPIQFVFGGASPYYNTRGVDAIPNYFKDYEVKVVPNASHFLFMEQRKGFCDHVSGFLARRVL